MRRRFAPRRRTTYYLLGRYVLVQAVQHGSRENRNGNDPSMKTSSWYTNAMHLHHDILFSEGTGLTRLSLVKGEWQKPISGLRRSHTAGWVPAKIFVRFVVTSSGTARGH